MNAYDQLFAARNVLTAQTLLTRRDLSDRISYLNARNTLLALLHYRVVPSSMRTTLLPSRSWRKAVSAKTTPWPR